MTKEQVEYFKVLGALMTLNPDNFLIDADGKLFSKCHECTDWHLITKLNLAVKK